MTQCFLHLKTDSPQDNVNILHLLLFVLVVSFFRPLQLCHRRLSLQRLDGGFLIVKCAITIYNTSGLIHQSYCTNDIIARAYKCCLSAQKYIIRQELGALALILVNWTVFAMRIVCITRSQFCT